MPHHLTGLPEPGEYNPYYGKYISLVPETELVPALESQLAGSLAFLRSIPAVRAGHRYAPGKWSVREVLGHVIDTERIFDFRALVFGRGERAGIPGFDENAYVAESNFEAQSLDALIAQYEITRRGTAALYDSFSPEAWLRRGSANANEISVRALAFITLGHERHHWAILRERYLAGAGS